MVNMSDKPVKISESSDSTKPVSPDAVEPKPAKSASEASKPVGAKPATPKRAPRVKDSVVSAEDTDTIAYSKARPARTTESRKSLTVLHIQRALAAEGIPAPVPSGRYDEATRVAVASYQATLDAEPTGLLTRDQFAALFEGDPNVAVLIDSHEDNA